MDQYEGSYVVRLLSLCLPSSCSTLPLFLISFFRPGPPLLSARSLSFSASLSLPPSHLSSVSFFESLMCTKRTEANGECLPIDRVRLSSVYPLNFLPRRRRCARGSAPAAAIPKCENDASRKGECVTAPDVRSIVGTGSLHMSAGGELNGRRTGATDYGETPYVHICDSLSLRAAVGPILYFWIRNNIRYNNYNQQITTHQTSYNRACPESTRVVRVRVCVR